MTDIQPLYIDGTEFDRPVIIAGPCSAESRRQVLDTAEQLHAMGIRIFRAGVWKPRTKPGGFEGIGEEALKWLAEVKQRYGMYVATEVATPAHVRAALDAGIDLLWIGARTSANPFAVQELADCLAEYPDTPILVKNPVNPDLELWIGAIQRLYNAGLRRLGAIHRGFSVYGQHLYRNMPQWHIPMELRRRMPQLPIFCDPSHIGGRRDLIAPLAQQALDMGFDGLIVESHCEPDCALSDRDQQVTPDELDGIVSGLSLRDKADATEQLTLLRQQIDEIDGQLIELLSKRMTVAREIGRFKKQNRMSVYQAGRYRQLLQSRLEVSDRLGLDPSFMSAVLQLIHEESVRQQL